MGVVVLLALGSNPASATTYSAVGDFSTSVNTNTSTWSYWSSPDVVHDGAYALLPAFSAPASGGVFLFSSPSTTGYWNDGFVPGVGVNDTGSPLCAWCSGPNPPFSWPNGTIWMHPGSGLVGVGWLSPIDAVVDIHFSFADMDPNVDFVSTNDGVAWSVDRNGTTLASGSFANGGGSGSQVLGTSVSAGDRIYFLVDPKAANSFDSTTFTATIETTPVPEPATLWLLGSGLAAGLGIRRRASRSVRRRAWSTKPLRGRLPQGRHARRPCAEVTVRRSVSGLFRNRPGRVGPSPSGEGLGPGQASTRMGTTSRLGMPDVSDLR
jgi:hypothetical protein